MNTAYIARLYAFAVWNLDLWIWDCLLFVGLRNAVPSNWLLPWRLLMNWYSIESYILTDMNGVLNFQSMVYLLLPLSPSFDYFCCGNFCFIYFHSWCCWYWFVRLFAVARPCLFACAELHLKMQCSGHLFWMGCKVLMGLLGFGVGSFWVSRLGSSFFGTITSLHCYTPSKLQLLIVLVEYISQTICLLAAVNSGSLFFCILYGVVSEEQCGFLCRCPSKACVQTASRLEYVVHLSFSGLMVQFLESYGTRIALLPGLISLGFVAIKVQTGQPSLMTMQPGK